MNIIEVGDIVMWVYTNPEEDGDLGKVIKVHIPASGCVQAPYEIDVLWNGGFRSRYCESDVRYCLKIVSSSQMDFQDKIRDRMPQFFAEK